MSGGRCFLDTNVFVYSVDPSDPRKSAIAVRLIRSSVVEENGCTSYQTVQEFLNVALKKFSSVMTPELASIYVLNQMKPLVTIESSMQLFIHAIGVQGRYTLNWYDSLIVAAAIEARCDVLYTEDLQHGQRFGDLVVTNPFL